MTRSRDLANLGDNTSTLENQGLTLIKTESFSAVSSHSVNDVFSATYSRYLILPNLIGSGVNQLNMRLRVGGSDNSSAQYRQQIIAPSSTNVNPERITARTNWLVGYAGAEYNFERIEIVNPFESVNTTGWSMNNEAITGNINYIIGGLGIDVTTSYTGFTLLPAAGTITGSVSVYGFNK